MTAAREIARMRAELRERYDAYDRSQFVLLTRLEELIAIGVTPGQSVHADLGEIVARICTLRMMLDPATYARETQVIGVIEQTLRALRARLDS